MAPDGAGDREPDERPWIDSVSHRGAAVAKCRQPPDRLQAMGEASGEIVHNGLSLAKLIVPSIGSRTQRVAPESSSPPRSFPRNGMSWVASASEALIADSIARSTLVAKSRSPLGMTAPMWARPCIMIRAPTSTACSAASGSEPGVVPHKRGCTPCAVRQARKPEVTAHGPSLVGARARRIGASWKRGCGRLRTEPRREGLAPSSSRSGLTGERPRAIGSSRQRRLGRMRMRSAAGGSEHARRTSRSRSGRIPEEGEFDASDVFTFSHPVPRSR